MAVIMFLKILHNFQAFTLFIYYIDLFGANPHEPLAHNWHENS